MRSRGSCTGIALALLALLLVSYGSARVSVDDGWFRAGRARIEAVHLGAVAALDAEETRRVAGPEADARAYLLLRPYLKRAVRVEIIDPADPAPYWLVCSRHPDELARAVRALSDSSRSDRSSTGGARRSLMGTVRPWLRTRCGLHSRWSRGSARPH